MIEIFNSDCLVKMKEYRNNHFDLAIVDPPYGINFAGEKERKAGRFKFKVKNWDVTIPDKSYFDELFRVSKKQIIWGGNYFIEHLKNTGSVIIWDKNNPKGMRFSDGEMAWSNIGGSLRIFKSQRTYQLEEQIHPTQKPVNLYDWLLKNYANEEDKILDTHLGSGSIAISCDKMGFDLVGIEIDKEYYNNACKRLKQHQNQMKLF